MEAVKAKVRYLKPEWKGRSERPRIGSRESRRANTDFYDVEITDARPLPAAGELGLDTRGFLLTQHRSAVRDFHNPKEVRATYLAEWEPRLRELTGASQVFFMNHLIRSETPRDFNDAYARYVHCDFSDETAEAMSRRLFVERTGADDAEIRRHAFAWYNVWQPVDREVQQNPLTVIDASTLEPGDVVEYLYTASNIEGVASMPIYNSKHRFYYFPHMQTDEAIVFKQLDSRPGRAYCCPHTSFQDPTAPDDALGRRSIELRAMAVFPRE